MNKLVSNYFYTVIYQILLMITPFITTPYLSRVLKPEGIGIDAYVSSIVQLFIIFSVLSIPMYGSRQIAIKPNINERSKEFWSIYLFQLIISLANILIFLIFISSISDHKILFYIHIFTFLAASMDITWFFIGREKLKQVTIRNILIKVLGIILIFTLVKDINDLPLYILINGGTLLLGQLIMWFSLSKEVKLVKVEIKDLKEHVVPIISLFIPQIMIQVYVLVNRIVLGNISGEVEVGFYNQANKVIKLVLGIITALGTVLLPRMASEFSKGNLLEMQKYTNYSLQFVLLITLPMVFGIIGISSNFVSWFLGEDFLAVSKLLIIMSPVILFVGLANVFGIQILISTNQQRKYTISITTGAVLSLITNFLLVQSLDSMATTIALLVAECVGAIIQMYFARKYFSMNLFVRLFIRYLVLSVILFFTVIFVGKIINTNLILLTIIQVSVGLTVYLTGLILFRDNIFIKFYNMVKNIIFKRLKIK